MREGWREFIPEVLRGLERVGASSIRSWLADNPTLTVPELGDLLGVRPLLVTLFARDRARAEGWSEEFARDALVRRLRRAMPQGWGHGGGKLTAEFRRAQALGGWATDLDIHVDDHFRGAVAALDESAPLGWLPDGPGDPLVIAVVQRLGWGQTSAPD